MEVTEKFVFRFGDAVVFQDLKERLYFDVLKPGAKTNIRGDLFLHDEIIGKPESFRMISSRENLFYLFKPTLSQYILKMPRGATVIYPKDLGTILLWGDIFPGATVVEAGLGSGALAMVLLRAVGPQGKVISYELREDFKSRAQKNIKGYLGDTPNHVVHSADIYDGIQETEVDRLVLDVPEPWRVAEHAAASLRAGGIFVSYSPTVLQVKETVDALVQHKVFVNIETMETILRPWSVGHQAVRPELQIIGHTGFLTFARKMATPLKG